MRILLEKLIVNYPYFFAVILFVIGVLTVLTRSNLFKKLLGINIMESAVFILFIAAGNIRGGTDPILDTLETGGRIYKSAAIGFDADWHSCQRECHGFRTVTDNQAVQRIWHC